MQIIVRWSNGTQSELEVAVPEGATPLQTSFKAPAPPTALHQQNDGSWACYSENRVLVGYCLPPKMMGWPVAGLSWAEARRDTAIARWLLMVDELGHPYITEESWTRDREMRLRHGEQFHFHGHATEQEAINCYQEFVRDFGEKEL
jgi:hypothetical protein